MKLAIRPNRKVGRKKYYHYYVDIPTSTVKSNHWHKGTILEVRKKSFY